MKAKQTNCPHCGIKALEDNQHLLKCGNILDVKSGFILNERTPLCQALEQNSPTKMTRRNSPTKQPDETARRK